VGASIAVPFFTNVSLTLKRINGPTATIYRGPCYGYSGTITYNFVGSQPVEGCMIEGVSCLFSWNQRVVKTLIPQPATFPNPFVTAWPYDTPLLQPYQWTYSKSDSAQYPGYPFWSDDYVMCTEKHTAQGSGVHGWNPDAWYQLDPFLLDLGDGSGIAFASSGVAGVVVQEQRTVTDHEWCEQQSATYETSVADNRWYLAGSAQFDPHLFDKPAIALSITQHPGDPSGWGQGENFSGTYTVSVNLTRGEYPR
jgi:hypothetical protein